MRTMTLTIGLMLGLILLPQTLFAQEEAAADAPEATMDEQPAKTTLREAQAVDRLAPVIIEESSTPIVAEEAADDAVETVTATGSSATVEAVATEGTDEAAAPQLNGEPVAERFVDSAPEQAPKAKEYDRGQSPVVDIEIRGDSSEAELAERLAVIREQYRLTLQALKQVYVDQSNAKKVRLVEKELEGLAAVEKPEYLSEVQIAPANLVARDSIAAADKLFKEGMDFKNYPAWPNEKRGKLRTAVEKFTTLIREYPTSDKISEAAFRLGEIYEGWYYEDFEKAAVAYERAFQWNPKTILPAKFRAARLYDEKLMRRDKAVELYKQVVLENLYKDDTHRAAKRVLELTGKQ